MTTAIALSSVGLQYLLRGVIVPAIALVLTVAGYRPAHAHHDHTTEAAAFTATYVATVPTELMTCTELRAICHEHGLRPGRSRASALAAVQAAGIR